MPDYLASIHKGLAAAKAENKAFADLDDVLREASKVIATMNAGRNGPVAIIAEFVVDDASPSRTLCVVTGDPDPDVSAFPGCTVGTVTCRGGYPVVFVVDGEEWTATDAANMAEDVAEILATPTVGRVLGMYLDAP